MLSEEELEQLKGGQIADVVNNSDAAGRNINGTSTCTCWYTDIASPEVTNKNKVEGCFCVCH